MNIDTLTGWQAVAYLVAGVVWRLLLGVATLALIAGCVWLATRFGIHAFILAGLFVLGSMAHKVICVLRGEA